MGFTIIYGVCVSISSCRRFMYLLIILSYLRYERYSVSFTIRNKRSPSIASPVFFFWVEQVKILMFCGENFYASILLSFEHQ